ncbi:MAG: MAPEG family protein [Steroidobacteraceae bacterium]
MLAATLLTVVAFVSVDRYWVSPNGLATGQRLLIAAKTDLFVVLWLAIAISNVARLRFFSPIDIEGSGSGAGRQQIRIASAFLQNTLEQVCVAVPAHLALATFYAGSPAIVPVLGGLFCLGRLFFWIRYRHGPVGRAFGFALTFYPSVGALLLSVFLVLS